MPFSFSYLARNSSSGNIDAGKAWIYNGTTSGSDETLATIVASGYFNAAQTTLEAIFPSGYTGTTGSLAVGDVISVRGTDSNGDYYVTSVTTNVTLAVWQSTSGVTYSGSPSVIGDLASFGNTSGDLVDSGVAATNLVLLTPTGNQTITADSLIVAQGNVQAGSSGHAGTVASYSSSASKGSLILAGVANTGNTNTTISNAAMGQASVISIPDPGASTAAFVLAPSALVSGNLVESTGTAGLVEDSGVTVASVSGAITQLGQLQQISVTLNTAAVVAAYATPEVLIAAPGSGKAIIVHSANVYTASTGNTAFATGVAPIIQYGTTAHGAGTIATGTGLVTGDITASTSQIRTIGPAASAVYTGISGEAVTFSCTTAYTAGTGTSVTFTLVYEVITATV